MISLSSFRSANSFHDGVSKNDGIGVKNNDFISTNATTFAVFIAKSRVDLLKILEFKQFLALFITTSDKARPLAADTTA